MTKKYKFPGFKQCMNLMRKHDALTQEEGFHALLPEVSNYVDELITEFHTEKDHGLKCWLLELLAKAKSEKALPLFIEYLESDDESFKYWAE